MLKKWKAMNNKTQIRVWHHIGQQRKFRLSFPYSLYCWVDTFILRNPLAVKSDWNWFFVTFCEYIYFKLRFLLNLVPVLGHFYFPYCEPNMKFHQNWRRTQFARNIQAARNPAISMSSFKWYRWGMHTGSLTIKSKVLYAATFSSKNDFRSASIFIFRYQTLFPG